MKLLKCYVENFGGLHKFTYSFNDGLNVIKEENGWGKSTLAVFIKAMFYGMPKRNVKSLNDNERKKYTPWQGGKYGGYLEFSADSGEYRIERFFGGKKEESFKLYDLKTGRLSESYSENIGEELFGIDADAYERSTYIPQRVISSQSENNSITAKINNLIEATNDLNNFESAVKALEKARKFYFVRGSSGKLQELNEKLSEKQLELEESETARESADELIRIIGEKSGEIEKICGRITAIQGQIDKINALKVKRANTEHYRELETRYRQLEEEYKSLRTFFKGNIPTDEEIKNISEKVRSAEGLREVAAAYATDPSDTKRLSELREELGSAAPTDKQLKNIQELNNELLRLKGEIQSSEAAAAENDQKYEELYGMFENGFPSGEAFAAKSEENKKLSECRGRLKMLALSEEQTKSYERLKRMFADSEINDQIISRYYSLNNQLVNNLAIIENADAAGEKNERYVSLDNIFSSFPVNAEEIDMYIDEARTLSDMQIRLDECTVNGEELEQFEKLKLFFKTEVPDEEDVNVCIRKNGELQAVRGSIAELEASALQTAEELERLGETFGEAALSEQEIDKYIELEKEMSRAEENCVLLKNQLSASEDNQLKTESAKLPVSLYIAAAFIGLLVFACGFVLKTPQYASFLAFAVGLAIISADVYFYLKGVKNSSGALGAMKYQQTAGDNRNQICAKLQAAEQLCSQRLSELTEFLAKYNITCTGDYLACLIQMKADLKRYHALIEEDKLRKSKLVNAKNLENSLKAEIEGFLGLCNISLENEADYSPFILDVREAVQRYDSLSERISMKNKEKIKTAKEAKEISEGLDSFLKKYQLDASDGYIKPLVLLKGLFSEYNTLKQNIINTGDRIAELKRQTQLIYKGLDDFVKLYIGDRGVQKDYSGSIAEIASEFKAYCEMKDAESRNAEACAKIQSEIAQLEESLASFALSYGYAQRDDYSEVLSDLKAKTAEFMRYKETKGVSGEKLSQLRQKYRTTDLLVRGMLKGFCTENVSDYSPVIEKLEQSLNELNAVEDRIKRSTYKRIEAQNRLKMLNNEINEFIDKYIASFEPDKGFSRCMEDLRTKYARIIAVPNELNEAKKAAQEFAAAKSVDVNEELPDVPSDLTQLDREKLELSEKADFLKEERARLNSRLTMLSDAADSLPDIQAEKEMLYQEKLQSEQNYSVIVKTEELLEKARENLSNKYLSRMQDNFKRYMEILTGAAVGNFSMDSSFNVRIERYGENKEFDYFSKGYKDIINMCIRFALVDVLFEGEQPFVILDDPFVNLDDGKVAYANAFLKRISERYQIIHLICHSSRG